MFVNGIQAGRKRAFFFSCGHLPIISESLGKIQIFSMFTLFFFFSKFTFTEFTWRDKKNSSEV